MPQAHIMKRLVKRMTIQSLPDTQYNAAILLQHTMHFLESCMSVCKEHQPKLAQDQIKVFIWKWELLRRACVPFHCNLIPFRRDACHVNHVWIEIETNDHSP